MKEEMRFLTNDPYCVLTKPLPRMNGLDGVMRSEYHRSFVLSEVWGILGFRWKLF